MSGLYVEHSFSESTNGADRKRALSERVGSADNASMPKTPSLPPTQSTPAVALREGRLGQVLGYQLAQATVVTQAIFEAEAMAVHQLRPVDYTVLALVRHNDGITAAQLASALALTPPHLAARIEKLMRRGLVEREPHPRDRRALHLRITPDGESVVDDTTARIVAAEEQALAPLSAGERLMLRELLHKAAHCRTRR